MRRRVRQTNHSQVINNIRLREQLQEERTNAKALQVGLSMNQGLLHDVTGRLRRAEGELERVRMTLTERFIGLDPTRRATLTGMPERERTVDLNLPRPYKPETVPPRGKMMKPAMPYDQMSLDLLLTHIEPDDYRHMINCYVTLGSDIALVYGITHQAMRDTPPQVLERRMMEELHYSLMSKIYRLYRSKP